jgi:hypothetical protein
MAITLLSNITTPLLRFTPLPAAGPQWQPPGMDKQPAPDQPDQPPAAPPIPPPPPPTDKEVGGRGGPDPVRYGDWEKGGIAVDF